MKILPRAIKWHECIKVHKGSLDDHIGFYLFRSVFVRTVVGKKIIIRNILSAAVYFLPHSISTLFIVKFSLVFPHTYTIIFLFISVKEKVKGVVKVKHRATLSRSQYLLNLHFIILVFYRWKMWILNLKFSVVYGKCVRLPCFILVGFWLPICPLFRSLWNFLESDWFVLLV